MAINKKIGKHSQAANDFLQPNDVTSLAGTNVGTARPFLATANTTSAALASGTGGAVDLSWTLPELSPAATSYTITTTPATYTVVTGNSTTSYRFQGLASNTAYTFTVIATNASGNSNAVTSSSVTATTVPDVPTSVTASAQVNQDYVAWAAPAGNGGSAITGYTLISSDGPTYTTAALNYTVPETAGTAQSYTVKATNVNGDSLSSGPSNSVTTLAPFFPPFFPPGFFTPPFFPPTFFTPPFFPPGFFTPPFFPPGFFTPPFFPPGFFVPPRFFVPPAFFAPPRFGTSSIRFKEEIVEVTDPSLED